MGTWGTALFSNDATSDIRDDFQAIVRAPWDGARLVDYLLAKFPAGADPTDEDYTDVNLAIADLLWQYGIRHPPAFKRAERIVDDGDDIEVKRLLGMAEAELNKRRKILEELREKWKSPNPRPRLRRMLIAPEPFLFEAGDCLFYPTSRGAIANPYVGSKSRGAYEALYKWQQDGWGTAIVLRTFRRHDVFARYLVAILDYAERDKPSLDIYPTLNILHTNASMFDKDAEPEMRIHSVHASSRVIKGMRVGVAGRVAVNSDVIAADFNLDAPPLSYGQNDFCDVAGINLDPRGNVPRDVSVGRYLR
jgi:hypothetical protein